MLTKFMRRIDENFKETENVRILSYITKKSQCLKKTIIEHQNTLENFNRRLDEAEERISDLEERAVELTQREQQREKRI